MTVESALLVIALQLAGPLQASIDPTTVALGLLTQLGDVWFVTTLAVLLYWLGPRTPVLGADVDRGRQASVLALVFLAVALAVALKAQFATPRPPGGLVAPTVPTLSAESVTAWLAGADGSAFPSGHGVLVTAGWGGLAWAIRSGSIRTRAAVATAVVLTVGVTRVALGLHTPTQVLAGVAVGLAALLVVLALGTPRRAFAVAIATALIGVAVVAPLSEVFVAAGLASGGFVAWDRLGRSLSALGESGALVATVVGVATVLPALVGLSVVEVLHPVFQVAASGVVGAVAVSLPLIGAQLVAFQSRDR